MSVLIDTASPAWSKGVPDWVCQLAHECELASQSAVARKLGCSASLVNQVLKGKYKGSLTAIEELVQGVFMNGTVTCPALGEMPANECQGWRRKSRQFVSVNSLRVRMFRACRRCPLNQKNGGALNG